jgi:hypothetical protein
LSISTVLRPGGRCLRSSFSTTDTTRSRLASRTCGAALAWPSWTAARRPKLERPSPNAGAAPCSGRGPSLCVRSRASGPSPGRPAAAPICTRGSHLHRPTPPAAGTPRPRPGRTACCVPTPAPAARRTCWPGAAPPRRVLVGRPRWPGAWGGGGAVLGWERHGGMQWGVRRGGGGCRPAAPLHAEVEGGGLAGPVADDCGVQVAVAALEVARLEARERHPNLRRPPREPQLAGCMWPSASGRS